MVSVHNATGQNITWKNATGQNITEQIPAQTKCHRSRHHLKKNIWQNAIRTECHPHKIPQDTSPPRQNIIGQISTSVNFTVLQIVTEQNAFQAIYHKTKMQLGQNTMGVFKNIRLKFTLVTNLQICMLFFVFIVQGCSSKN